MASRACQFVLAFDAKCGPCSRFKAIVGLIDAKRRIRFVSLEEAEQSGLLADIAPASRCASFHLIRSPHSAPGEASLWSGSEALLPLARLLPPLGRAVSRTVEATPGGVTAITFAYSTLSRLHRGCSLSPEESASNGSTNASPRPFA